MFGLASSFLVRVIGGAHHNGAAPRLSSINTLFPIFGDGADQCSMK